MRILIKTLDVKRKPDATHIRHAVDYFKKEMEEGDYDGLEIRMPGGKVIGGYLRRHIDA